MPRLGLVLLLAHSPLVARAAAAAPDCGSYWLEHQRHGFSFRDARDFGAVGDGVADDTAALQRAIDHARGGDAGSGADKAAAFVYLRAGRYRVTDTLVLWKWTTLQGNGAAGCAPVIALDAHAAGFGDARALKPLIVTNDGFNSTTALHEWWREDADVGGNTNENFFTSIRHVDVEVGAGNAGAVGITWNVAQQTSLRFVRVDAGDAAIGIDVGAGADYARWADGGYNLGGGGVVEDVRVTGGGVGLRLAAAQFFLRAVELAGARAVGLHVWQLGWSLVVLALRVEGAPLGVRAEGLAGAGALQLLDASFANISGGVAVATDGASPVYVQNLRADASVRLGVDGGAPPPVAAWAANARAYDGGAPRAGGALPLPPLADAAAGGARRACAGGALCGGSAEAPATGVPAVPLPEWGAAAAAAGEAIGNALDAGARGDGATDDTAALQAALDAHRFLFIPFGIYVVSDTLRVRADARVFGEGLSVLLLAAGAPGFGGGAAPAKPLLLVPAGANASIADISLWSAECGNEGAVMVEWGGGAGSTMHDVNMLLSVRAAAKAVVPAGAAGYWSK